MIGSMPPFLVFLIGTLFIFLVPGRWKSWFSVLITLIALVNFLCLSHGTFWHIQILEYELVFGRIDPLSYLFGLLFHIAAVIATLFALHVRDPYKI